MPKLLGHPVYSLGPATLNNACSTVPDQLSRGIDESDSLVEAFYSLVFGLKKANNERLAKPLDEWKGLEPI